MGSSENHRLKFVPEVRVPGTFCSFPGGWNPIFFWGKGFNGKNITFGRAAYSDDSPPITRGHEPPKPWIVGGQVND